MTMGKVGLGEPARRLADDDPLRHPLSTDMTPDVTVSEVDMLKTALSEITQQLADARALLAQCAAFLGIIEWTDTTSEDEAANLLHAIQETKAQR